jgi:signal transduction histidine kinase
VEQKMKNAITTEAVSRIFELLEEMVLVERTAALEMLAEVERFLEETDFSGSDVDQINMLIGVARFHINGRDTTKAYDALTAALKIAEESNLPDEVLHVQSVIAVVYSLRGDHLKAIYIWEEMLLQMDEDHRMWMPIVNNLVVAYSFTKQFTRAVDLSFRLLHFLDERDGEPAARIATLINLGNAYTPLKSHTKALKVYHEALELAISSDNVPYQSYIHGNMARTYSEQNDYLAAYEHGLKALKISESHYGESHIADSLSSLGSICVKSKRYQEAKELLDRSLFLFDVENDKVGYTNALLTKCTLHLEQEQFDAGYVCMREAAELCEGTDIVQHRNNLYKLQNEYYAGTGDFQKANESLMNLVKLQEEQYDQLSENMISKQEAEYLRHKIELQNTSYQQKNKELERSNKLINRQARQLKKSNRELQSSLSMLNRLISIISHDVRGPAANSAAALRMIKEGEIGATASHEIMGHVIDNLDAVTDLLAEIMVWIESRSFKQGVDRLMKDVNVLGTLQPVLKFFQGQVRQKNIRVDLQYKEKNLLSYTEPNIMKIVLRNILSNAIKFTPVGGEITIVCRKQPEHLELTISDTGVGMTQREIADLLKHGLKAKAGTSREIGMGMGLRLSLAYLKLLGVGFEIHSEVGEGTRFVLKLQLAHRE